MSESMPFPEALAEGSDVDSMPEITLPLAGDTGALSPQLSWHLDWFEFTSWGADANDIAKLMSEAIHPGHAAGIGSWTSRGGAKFYARRYEYLGATLLTESQAKGAEENVHGVIPGDACSAAGVDSILNLLVRLKAWSSRCNVTRLDLAVDGAPFTPRAAYEAVQEGATVSRVNRGRDEIVRHGWYSSNGEGDGNTLYIGSAGSDRYLRIYDRRGPTRIELQTKRAYANAVAVALVNLRGSDLDQAEFVVACLREFCDFGRRRDGVHGARGLELLPWWREFVGSVDRIGKLTTDPRLDLSVDRTMKWVEKSVVPSLAMISACYRESGRYLLDAWIEEGRDRLSPEQLAAIQEFRHAYQQAKFKPGFDDSEAA